MTTRPITEEDLHGFVDECLVETRRAEVAAYLAAHPDVARRVEAYARQRDRLRTVLAPLAEAPIPPELSLSRIEAARFGRTPVWRAAAAVLLVSIGGAGGWVLHGLQPGSPAGVEAVAQEALDSYQTFAPDRLYPVEFRAEAQSQWLPWASQRLDRRLKLPDLSASGYRLMGARVAATTRGPALMLMYDDDRGTRLVLFSRTMQAEARDVPTIQGAAAGAGTVSWVQAGIGYSLAGPDPAGALRPLADEIRRQMRDGA